MRRRQDFPRKVLHVQFLLLVRSLDFGVIACQQILHYHVTSDKKEDKAKAINELWLEFFANPTEWLDNRSTKRNEKSPDFVHSLTKEALWIDGRLNPPWVAAELPLLDVRDGRGERAAYQCTIGKNGILDRVARDDVSEGIRKLCEEGQLDEALHVLNSMEHHATRITTIFTYLLQGCSSKNDLIAGRAVDCVIIKSGLESNAFWGSHLIHMFAACGSLLDACRVFNRLMKPSALSWSAIISAHSKAGQFEKAIELYEQMLHAGVKPTEHVFVAVLKACASTTDLALGKAIHSHAIKSGFESDLYVGSCLMEMYAKCGSLDNSRRVFEKLSKQDVVSWTTMIAAYAQHGQGQEALELFHWMMQQSIDPNIVTFVSVLKACSNIAAITQGKLIHAQVIECGFELNKFVRSTLIDLYVKCGQLKDAHKVFDKLHKQDVVTWSTMIAGVAQHGHPQEVLQLFQQMQQEGMKPNNITFVSILQACSSVGALKLGQLLHAHMIDSGFELDAFVVSILIDMYSKYGGIQDACRVFDKLPKQNAVTWSAMIAGYTLHSDYRSALRSLKAMQQEGLKPDSVTFVTVLSLCGRVGLVDQGCFLFQSMSEEHGVLPTLEHYTCMIDLFGRAGCLVEAEDVIQTMPFPSKIPGWMSLLGNCRTHGNIEVGRRCFDAIVSLNPIHPSGYVLMSKIYGDAGMWKDAQSVRDLRKCVYAAKSPGKALTEIDGKVHDFTVGDKTHPQNCLIYSKLIRLSAQMKEEGHVPNIGLRLQNRFSLLEAVSNCW